MVIDGRTLRWSDDSVGISLFTCLDFGLCQTWSFVGKTCACQIILVCCKVLPKSFCSSLPLDNLIQQLAPSASSMLSPTSRLETLVWVPPRWDWSAKEIKWHRLSWKCCYCLILYAIACQCSVKSGRNLSLSIKTHANKSNTASNTNKCRVPISSK